MPTIKTYFLAPGWDFSAEAITPGSIITNPMHPALTLFKPAASDLDPLVRATSRSEFSNKSLDDGGNSAGLFRTFLGLFGLGNEDGFHYDRKRVLSYSFRGLESHSFAPTSELKNRALRETDRVAQFCRASEYRASVFMVTGIKTVRGAGVTTGSSKGGAWRVQLGVELEEGAVGEGRAPAVFAFELAELRLSATGEISSVGDGGEESVAVLQARLDRDFGKATFTAIEGFDEEDESPCKIVASSPAYIDLLTASSARIDPSVLRVIKG